MAKESNLGKWLTAVTATLILLFIVVQVVSYFFYPAFMPWFEQRDAGEEIIENEIDAETSIQDYREFRRLYHDIEAQREQVENAYDELNRFYDTWGNDTDDWSREARVRHGRIQERITGNQNQLENLIAEYNAMSDDATTEIFKCHLPYKVDEQFAISGPPGSGDVDEPVDTGPDGEQIEDGTVPPAEECDGLPDKVDSDS